MIASSPERTPDLLFVYGTLRRGFRFHHYLKRIAARYVTSGKVQAELFDLGEFPGARPSTRPGEIVAGELYRFHNVDNALKVLDQVEGFSPQTPDKGLFRRGTAEVQLPNGERRLAWIYWLKPGPGVRTRIVRRWAQARSSPLHAGFQ